MSEPGISFFHPFQAFHPARQTPRPSPVNPWLRGSGDTRYQVECHVQESMQTMPNAHELHLIGEAPRGASRLALYDTGWVDARCVTRQHCGHPLRLSRTRALSVLSDANFAISLNGWPESEPASPSPYLGDAVIFRVRGSHDKQLVLFVDRNRMAEGVFPVSV